MNLPKALLNFITDGVVTCKQFADFYDVYHDDDEFPEATDFLSGILVIDMAQLKEVVRYKSIYLKTK
ncbi:MAG: hypothetical protein GX180_14400 [Enterococcus sp.]|nr:hypothetical protein [Enterococcus sp.]